MSQAIFTHSRSITGRGQWMLVTRHTRDGEHALVIVSCPECGTWIYLDDYHVLPDGTVVPYVECPGKERHESRRCRFNSQVYLELWKEHEL